MNYIDDIIHLAIREDISTGDITTENLIPDELTGVCKIVAKENFIVAGLEVAKRVFELFNNSSTPTFNFNDGDEVKESDTLMVVKGRMVGLLKAERIALNFLQRLSGIATKTREYVQELKEFNTRLVDTRKTTPGLRVLEKYAVRVGKGFNHRMGLYDGVLIKDNHLSIVGGVKKAVTKIRDRVSHLVKIEVEVSNFKELKEALECKVDVIMLDNMNLTQIEEAIKLIKGRAIVEVSGNITKEKLKPLAMLGVDIISSGAIIHQATSVDISMRIDISQQS